jgi:6-pyruvoyl-tetrahydropterin synthase
VVYTVEVERQFTARQGLPSPIRADHGPPRLAGEEAAAGVAVVLTAGVTFSDDQLTERGWFFDTDAAAVIVQPWCDRLAHHRWTELFSFRPTFELVARHLFHELSPHIPQLAFVALRDNSYGTTTRYSPAAAHSPARHGDAAAGASDLHFRRASGGIEHADRDFANAPADATNGGAMVCGRRHSSGLTCGFSE